MQNPSKLSHVPWVIDEERVGPRTAPARARLEAAVRISVLAAAAAALAACGHSRTFEKPPRPVKVEAAMPPQASRGSRYSAHIEANRKVQLAFKVGGYVDRILQRKGTDGRARDLQQGDVVSAGEVLARLRSEDYEASAAQAKGMLDQASAGQAKAHLDFERASHLFEAKSLTKSDFDAVKASSESADAQLASARGQLDAAQIALGDTALRAPMDALVLDRSIEVGRLVGAGTVGFTLADVRTVKAVFGVPDMVVGSLKEGAKVAVVTESMPEAPFMGTITAVSPAADSSSRVFQIEVTVPNPQERLKVGMIATVQMPAWSSADGREPAHGARAGGAVRTAGAKGAGRAAAGGDDADGIAAAGRDADGTDAARAEAAAPVVPLTAIVKSSKSASGYAVFIVEGEGDALVARERTVHLGGVFGNRIELADGVRSGERAIVSGATLVTDGEPVRIIP